MGIEGSVILQRLSNIWGWREVDSDMEPGFVV